MFGDVSSRDVLMLAVSGVLGFLLFLVSDTELWKEIRFEGSISHACLLRGHL
jgi:hypothetical protein